LHFIGHKDVKHIARLTDVLYRFVLIENPYLFLYKIHGKKEVLIEKDESSKDLKVFHGVEWVGMDIHSR